MPANDIRIHVAYHRTTPPIANACLAPIHAGRAIAKAPVPNMPGDDTGDAISSKNLSYCELTVIYWMWRNVQASHYGLFHYRRLLNLNPSFTVKQTICNASASTLVRYHLDAEHIIAACNAHDIILPLPRMLDGLSVTQQYAKHHHADDLDICADIIRTRHAGYIQDMERTFADNRGYFFNMFIMRGDIFHEYAAWLFDILTEAEKRITVSDDPYQRRVFGFLAERLSGVFVEHKRRTSSLRIRECPLVIGDFDATFFKRLRHWRKNNFSVRLGKGRCSATLFGKRVL